MKIIRLLALFILIPTLCISQNKKVWRCADLVTIDGKVEKRFWATSSVTFIGDSIIVVSCENEKLISLLTTPWRGLLDETTYRVFKRIGPQQSITDSVGTIYRYTYEHLDWLMIALAL